MASVGDLSEGNLLSKKRRHEAERANQPVGGKWRKSKRYFSYRFVVESLLESTKNCHHRLTTFLPFSQTLIMSNNADHDAGHLGEHPLC